MTRRLQLAAVVALALVVATYANSFQNGFHFDDFHTIVDNPYVRSLHNVPRFFADATTFSVLPANRTYRPLVSTALAFDYRLARGYNPLWFHLSTFLVFLLQLAFTAWLYRTVLLRTGALAGTTRTHPWRANSASIDTPARTARQRRAAPGRSSSTPTQPILTPPLATAVALAAAAFYAVHPAIAETINYIIQRADVYAALGVIAALAIYAALPRYRRFGLYLLPLVFGLLSKPPAASFVALLYLYLHLFEPGAAPTRARRAADRLFELLPTLVVTGGLMVLQVRMTPRTFVPSTISTSAYLLTQPFVLLRYFTSLFLPLHLNIDTDLQPFAALTPEALLGLIFLAALLTAAFVTARNPHLRPVSFGLWWFLLTSLPTSLYRLSEVENDHRMYLPFAALSLALVWTVFLLLQRLPARARRPGVALALLLLLPYAWGTHLRNRAWRSEESLWLDDIQKSPRNGRGLMIYALTQMNKGDYPTALRYLQQAQIDTPNYPTLEINLGTVYTLLEQPSEAEPHFIRAISLAPNDDQPRFYYARFLFQTHRIAESIPEARQAIALNPARLPARNLLAQDQLADGDPEAAQRTASETLALAPTDPEAKSILAASCAPGPDYWINASLRHYQQDDFPACVLAAHNALALSPRSHLAYNNLGACLAGLGQWDEAAAAERQALASQPGFELARNNLALYLAHGGNAAGGDHTAPNLGLLPQPATPESLLNDSLLEYRSRHYRQSIDAARAALRLRPNYAEAWNNIAAASAALARWDDAIAAARQAIRIKPDFQLARNNLAWALAQNDSSKSSRPAP